MRAFVFVLVSAMLVLAAAPVAAQGDNDLACQDRRQAKREFNKGRLAYRRGDYEEAILKWQESYAMCEEPLIHLNIANAYERLGDLKPALDHLRKWRLVAPLREHGELDARIAGLATRVAEQDRTDAATQATEQARLAEEQRQRDLANQQTPTPMPEPTKSRRERTLNIVGWSLVGVGGAAVIAGVVLDVVAATSRPEQAQACTDSAGRLLCRDAQRDDIESSNTLALAGDITWIAGAVVAAGGATVLVLNATGVFARKERATATPPAAWLHELRIAPFGAGAQLLGAF